jgi:hypothetical protein
MSSEDEPMTPSSKADRIEQAFSATAPFDLLTVARQLRDEGMTQAELLALYDSFREQHATDTDETRYNAILDTMDFIYGWCNPSDALFPCNPNDTVA